MSAGDCDEVFYRAAKLSLQVNFSLLKEPLPKVSVAVCMIIRILTAAFAACVVTVFPYHPTDNTLHIESVVNAASTSISHLPLYESVHLLCDGQVVVFLDPEEYHSTWLGNKRCNTNSGVHHWIGFRSLHLCRYF